MNSSNRLRSDGRKPKRSKKRKNSENTTRNTVVNFDSTGTPVDLLGGGEHFTDCPALRVNTYETNHPMDAMIESVEKNELTRPTVR